MYRKYAVQSVNTSMSNLNYAHAQAQRKKDPYIRGGMAQGIAGVGAGIYTAIDISNRNAKIDQSREYWKNEAKKDNEKEKSMECKVISLMNQLLKELLTIPKIKEYREKIIESNYIQAKQLQSKVYSFNNIMRAQEKFEVLGNYKDSKQLKLKCND